MFRSAFRRPLAELPGPLPDSPARDSLKFCKVSCHDYTSLLAQISKGPRSAELPRAEPDVERRDP